ncbi:MAG: hypothetical protein MJE77_27045 [Proteobacteria bacterium]|nr:hypothetical protein [Pseudomonadota bacterium]
MNGGKRKADSDPNAGQEQVLWAVRGRLYRSEEPVVAPGHLTGGPPGLASRA